MLRVSSKWYMFLLGCVSCTAYADFLTWTNYKFAQLHPWQSPMNPPDTQDYIEEINAKKGVKEAEVTAKDARLSRLMQRKTVEISKLLERTGSTDVSRGLKLVFASTWYGWQRNSQHPFTLDVRDQIEAWEREEEEKNKAEPDFEIYSSAALRKSDTYASNAALPFKIIIALIAGGCSYFAYKKYRQRKEKEQTDTMKTEDINNKNLYTIYGFS